MYVSCVCVCVCVYIFVYRQSFSIFLRIVLQCSGWNGEELLQLFFEGLVVFLQILDLVFVFLAIVVPALSLPSLQVLALLFHIVDLLLQLALVRIEYLNVETIICDAIIT